MDRDGVGDGGLALAVAVVPPDVEVPAKSVVVPARAAMRLQPLKVAAAVVALRPSAAPCERMGVVHMGTVRVRGVGKLLRRAGIAVAVLVVFVAVCPRKLLPPAPVKRLAVRGDAEWIRGGLEDISRVVLGPGRQNAIARLARDERGRVRLAPEGVEEVARHAERLSPGAGERAAEHVQHPHVLVGVVEHVAAGPRRAQGLPAVASAAPQQAAARVRVRLPRAVRVPDGAKPPDVVVCALGPFEHRVVRREARLLAKRQAVRGVGHGDRVGGALRRLGRQGRRAEAARGRGQHSFGKRVFVRGRNAVVVCGRNLKAAQMLRHGRVVRIVDRLVRAHLFVEALRVDAAARRNAGLVLPARVRPRLLRDENRRVHADRGDAVFVQHLAHVRLAPSRQVPVVRVAGVAGRRIVERERDLCRAVRREIGPERGGFQSFGEVRAVQLLHAHGLASQRVVVVERPRPAVGAHRPQKPVPLPVRRVAHPRAALLDRTFDVVSGAERLAAYRGISRADHRELAPQARDQCAVGRIRLVQLVRDEVGVRLVRAPSRNARSDSRERIDARRGVIRLDPPHAAERIGHHDVRGGQVVGLVEREVARHGDAAHPHLRRRAGRVPHLPAALLAPRRVEHRHRRAVRDVRHRERPSVRGEARHREADAVRRGRDRRRGENLERRRRHVLRAVERGPQKAGAEALARLAEGDAEAERTAERRTVLRVRAAALVGRGGQGERVVAGRRSGGKALGRRVRQGEAPVPVGQSAEERHGHAGRRDVERREEGGRVHGRAEKRLGIGGAHRDDGRGSGDCPARVVEAAAEARRVKRIRRVELGGARPRLDGIGPFDVQLVEEHAHGIVRPGGRQPRSRGRVGHEATGRVARGQLGSHVLVKELHFQ